MPAQRAVVTGWGAIAILVVALSHAGAAAPTLSLSPATGPPGQKVTAAGTAWDPTYGAVRIFRNQSDVYTGSNPLATATPDSTGGFSVQLDVPNEPAGSYQFVACQSCGDVDFFPSASAAFTILPFPPPSLSLSSGTGLPGQKVTAAGTGWDPKDGAVRIFRSQSDVNTGSNPLATATPDSTGAFSVQLDVPNEPPGSYEFVACQRCGDADGFPSTSAAFGILPPPPPTLSLSRATGVPEQTVTAVGSGWDPNEGLVRIFPDRSDVANPSAALVTATPDSTGGFSVRLAIPMKPAGSYEFVACQRCGDPDGFPAATASFEIVVVPTSSVTTTPPPQTTTPTPQTTTTTIASSPDGRSAVLVVLLSALLVVLIVLGLIAGSWWFLRRPTARWRRPAWEANAEDEEPRGPCEDGRWRCHRGSPNVDLKLRQITELRAEFRNAGAAPERRQIDVGDHVLATLNQCLTYELARSERKAVQELAAQAARGLWATIERELTFAAGPFDIPLFVNVQGGEATWPFSLYQCRRTHDSTSRWTKRAEWTGKLKDEKLYEVGVLRSVNDVRAVGDVVTQAMADRFVEVIRTISSDHLLKRIRPGSEWELDLGDYGSVTF